MAEIIDLFFSLLDLLKGTLLALPIPFILVLIGVFIRRKISEKFNFKWLFSSFLSVLLIAIVLAELAYFIPVYFGLSQSFVGLPPPSTGYNIFDMLLSFLFQFFRLLIVSAILSLIAMPFVLFGAIAFDFIASKLRNHFIVHMVIAVYASLLVFFFIWFYPVPQLLQAVVYLIYFWLG